MSIEALLTREEKAVLALRELFSASGCEPFRMSKFEEYDLYSRYKDFLISENIISFTDTSGRLMALKPDVTLSLIRSTRPVPAGETLRLSYHENVYRVAGPDGRFREIPQAGVEFLGCLDTEQLAQLTELAARSLSVLSPDCVLSVSHLDLLSALIARLGLAPEAEAAVRKACAEKSESGIRGLCAASGAPAAETARLAALIGLSGPPREVLPRLLPLVEGTGAEESARELARVLEGADARLPGLLRIDFSVAGNTRYYNGLIFQGFVRGVPGSVLSGGQYDRLLARMGRRERGAGFAVYLDQPELFSPAAAAPEKDWINVALPKGRLGDKVLSLFAAAGYGAPVQEASSRKLVLEDPVNRLRYFWVKPSDVAIYVERGAADLGVAGKDILLEYEPNVYELLDLGLGKCRMAVAGPAAFTPAPGQTLRVATKFSHIADTYYAGLGRNIEIIHLNGSIELAPLLGLSDVIVDIVETGTTLRENDLAVLSEIAPISARVIANPSGYAFKTAAISGVIRRLAAQKERV
ncbi:MAG: ATP phosphoribosyltransferase [Lachnospiraceae bacterium]|nr:ATP phosphoribosyltransferase [Lachnospiraceae bacterium]